MDFKLEPVYEVFDDVLMDALVQVYKIPLKVAYAIVKEYFYRGRENGDGWEESNGMLSCHIGKVYPFSTMRESNIVEEVLKEFAKRNPDGYFTVFADLDILSKPSLYKPYYFEKDINISCPRCGGGMAIGEVFDIEDGKVYRDSDSCMRCDYDSQYTVVDVSDLTVWGR